MSQSIAPSTALAMSWVVGLLIAQAGLGAAALASEASGQRGDSMVRAPDTRPEPGSTARAFPASAQTYPTRPVVIVVPFAAGGGNDILARLLAQRMGAALGQQFVIENRPGAGGTLGARAVAKAPPDGYTLMVGHSGVFGIAPSLYANPGYDPRKDFAPIGLIGSY